MKSPYPYFTHGSEDSLDTDVYFVVDKLSDRLDDNKKLCDQLSHDNGVNGNLICVQDGIVSAVFKGTVDEVNNSLFSTYGLHKQDFPNPIIGLVERDICLKWVRVVRGILSHCSRTEHREIVKMALRSDNIVDKVAVLRSLDFTKIETFNKEPAAEVYKFICFQSAQYLGLLSNKEIYTKSQAAEFLGNEEIQKFLYRQPANVESLNRLVWAISTFLPIKSKDAEYSIDEDGKIFKTPFGSLVVKTEKYLPK